MKQDLKYGVLIQQGFRELVRGNNPFVLVLGSLIATAGSIVSLGLLIGPFSVGLAKASLKVARGEAAEMDDLKAGFENFVPSFVAGLLVLLAVGLGTVLLIVPGLIALFAFMYTAHVLADDPELTAIDAMKESYAVAKENLSPTTVLLVLSAALSTLLSATGVGAIIAGGLIAVLIAQFYVATEPEPTAEGLLEP